MMRKIISASLAAVLMFALTSCYTKKLDGDSINGESEYAANGESENQVSDNAVMNDDSADEPGDEKKPYDEEIAAAAENYMTRWSNNSYMHTEYDLKEATILDPNLTDEEVSSAAASGLW